MAEMAETGWSCYIFKSSRTEKEPESIEMQEQKPVPINTQEILWSTHSL